MFGITIGSIWLIILIDVLVVMTAVALGLLISSITYTVVESVELAMYIFFVSVLTSGIVSPKEVHFPLYNYFIKIIPFSYAVDASRRVNMAGAEWSHVANNIYILLGFFIVFMLLSAILLRREAR